MRVFILSTILAVMAGINLLQAQVILNEVMFNPSGSEHTDEFVEIWNQEESSVIDLSGWIIGDGEGDDVIIDAGGGTLLRPGQFGLILDPDYLNQSDTYDSLIPDSALVLTIDGSTFGSAGFSNSRAEPVILMDSQGIVKDSIRYRIDVPSGHSFERREPNDSEWLNSQSEHGTPGAVNSVAPAVYDGAIARVSWEGAPEAGAVVQISVLIQNAGKKPMNHAVLKLYQDDGDSVLLDSECVAVVNVPGTGSEDSSVIQLLWKPPDPGKYTMGVCLEYAGDEKFGNNTVLFILIQPYPEGELVINEFMCHPLPDFPEWVELFNPQGYAVDLNGWSITDNTGQSFMISECRRWILPGDFAILSEAEFMDGNAADIHTIVLPAFPGLNNLEDSIVLRDPSGSMIDSVHYHIEGEAAGVSRERILWNGNALDSENWHMCTSLQGMTPGYRNSVFYAGKEVSGKVSITPNPFCPDGDGIDEVALIGYSLPCDFATLTLRLYDIGGRCIRDLRTGQESAREGVVVWEGFDNTGRIVRTGLYILFLEALDSGSGSIFRYKTTLVFSGAAL